MISVDIIFTQNVAFMTGRSYSLKKEVPIFSGISSSLACCLTKHLLNLFSNLSHPGTLEIELVVMALSLHLYFLFQDEN